MKFKKKYFILFIIFLISFILLELLLFFLEKKYPYRFDSDYSVTCVEKSNNSVIYYSYKKNCHYTFYDQFNISNHNKEISFKTNSCFMRGEEDKCLEFKKNISNRILFFGDSYTQNMYLHNQSNFSEIFLTKLKKNNINNSVFNFGVPGYSLKQNVENIMEITKDINIKNNYVVLQFLANDIFDISEHPSHFLKKYLNFSHTFRALNHIRRNLLYKDTIFNLEKVLNDEYNKQEKISDMQKNFCNLKDYLSSKEAIPILLVLPFMDTIRQHPDYYDEEIDQKIIRIAKNCGWNNVIYPISDIKKNNFSRLILLENKNYHFNEFGNSIIADQLFIFFKNKYLLLN